MEQSNKIQRSEVWEQIYNVVSKIPRKDVDGDAADAPSVATELEELFLKLLPIQGITGSSCPKCQNEMIIKENMLFWRGKYLSGLVCDKCNALYDNPKESFMEYVKRCR